MGKLKKAEEISKAIGEQAQELGTKAQFLAKGAGEWAEPRLTEAVDKLKPLVADAVENVRPKLNEAQDKVVNDYVPRIQQAMKDAAKAASAEGTVTQKAQRAGEAAQEAFTAAPKKSHKGLKALGWVVAGSVAAGAGYILWRRSQPVEDPWAEEYWQNVADSDEATQAPQESSSLTQKATAAAAVVTEKAQSIAKDVADRVKGTVEDASAKLAELADDAAPLPAPEDEPSAESPQESSEEEK